MKITLTAAGLALPKVAGAIARSVAHAARVAGVTVALAGGRARFASIRWT